MAATTGTHLFVGCPQQAMSIINSQPALLSLPEEGLDGVVYTLKAFLDENEAGIITAVRKQPHLLSMGAKGLLPEKVTMHIAARALCEPILSTTNVYVIALAYSVFQYVTRVSQVQ